MNPIDQFRQRLQTGPVCLGASITFTDPLVTHALADSVEFFWIDLEHGLMSADALHGHLLAAHAKGVPALVRVTAGTTPFIKPILDSGVDGIIVPQIRSAEEVRQVVADCRYPPLGRRGYGPRVPSNYGRDGGRDYVDRANHDIFVSVQIETVDAVEAIDEIVAVPNLDSLVLGPWDLSAAMGRIGDVEHPDVIAALELVIAKARAAGLSVGSGMGPDSSYAALMAQRGVKWIQMGADYGYLIASIDQLSREVRQRLVLSASE
jgi:2-dehydro-3-deoxyglucarate aldolase/4-hydroxy-2-oxoheptanedioate aldolase